MVSFGQIVIGPPGSGKSTYCNGMSQLLNQTERPCIVVNMDPANDFLPYDCALNVMDLVSLEKVMESEGLGPNGGTIYCIEYLHDHFDWLENALEPYLKENYYIIFDCPGQVELFTHITSMKGILGKLHKLDLRLCAIQLCDSSYCMDHTKYISALLLCLKTMLHIELPMINVLSKIDLVENSILLYELSFYKEASGLEYLLENLNFDKFGNKFKKLNEAICELVEDFSLVSFETLNIQDKDSVSSLIKKIDKANGFVPFTQKEAYGTSKEIFASDK
ncbi:hypothetical protein ROZALSC1DRAFT_27935 [Rozella allomycis CSF55]|uniref:GPN-loop GTPase 2 n=1 Tax=Rozella allomycis (strain CSF55) TaxID=988480 RepID=A0A4P9YM61_ROZAC|nr:hypothetical protein ROZALSC1DRAFT_27935 [Rozella allomycis CSF55]